MEPWDLGNVASGWESLKAIMINDLTNALHWMIVVSVGCCLILLSAKILGKRHPVIGRIGSAVSMMCLIGAMLWFSVGVLWPTVDSLNKYRADHCGRILTLSNEQGGKHLSDDMGCSALAEHPASFYVPLMFLFGAAA